MGSMGFLKVCPEEDGNWSVLHTWWPAYFVDIHSPIDCYLPEMWHALATYLEQLDGDDMYLPAGRYDCAQALKARGLPFLKDRSLGEVCHIVELAGPKHKKLIGYLKPDKGLKGKKKQGKMVP